jgi:hypothetical protein
MIGTLLISAALLAQAAPPKAALPRPSGDPMAIDLDTDPIIAIERETAAIETFRSLMTAALARHPAISEAKAGADEAEAARDLARAAQLPSGDVSFSSARTLARDFSNDPNNIIERSRRKQRTDAIASIQQPLFDFGASALRTSAAKARINAAAARVDATVDEIGLRAILPALHNCRRAMYRSAARERSREISQTIPTTSLKDPAASSALTRLPQSNNRCLILAQAHCAPLLQKRGLMPPLRGLMLLSMKSGCARLQAGMMSLPSARWLNLVTVSPLIKND